MAAGAIVRVNGGTEVREGLYSSALHSLVIKKDIENKRVIKVDVIDKEEDTIRILR